MSSAETEVAAATTVDDIPNDEEVAGAAAAPAGDGTPDWVKEGTTEDEDDIPSQAVAGAKPMEPFGDWVEPAKGVELEIVKAVVETYVPRDESEWKFKQMNVHLKVKNGITYKAGQKPMYKGKMFFHRFYVAVNRAAEQAGVYDFSKNAQGKPTVFWDVPRKGDDKAGQAWGDYNEFLVALGFPTDGSLRNNKSFRDSLVGRGIIYDIDKDKKEEYNRQTEKREKVAGEFVNALRHAKATKVAAVAPVAAAATADTPDWES